VSGNLFGTTSLRGPSEGGTVFEVQAVTHAISTLAIFNLGNGTNGAYPQCGLIAHSSGSLFGITPDNGAFGWGTWFQLQNAITATVAVTTPGLANWIPNKPGYNQTLSATGGTAPYAFATTSGQLPPGLTLDSSGAISGTPTASGNYNVTITATDSTGLTGSQN